MTVQVLIVGVPRSGTTFLLSELSKYTGSLPLSEPIRFYESFRCKPTSIIGRVNILRIINRKLHPKTSSSNSVAQYIKCLENSRTNFIIKETFRSHSPSDIPTHYIKNFTRTAPQKIICIKRSPYDVIQSVLNRGDNTLLTKQLVRDLTHNVLEFNNFIESNNLFSIDYVDLLNNKYECIESISNKFPSLFSESEKIDSKPIYGTGDQLALKNKPLSAKIKSHKLTEDYKTIISSILDA